MNLIHNERTKLTASWLNTLATAVIVSGTFASIAALLYGFQGAHVGPLLIIAISVICLVAGTALHLLGRHLLGALKP